MKKKELFQLLSVIEQVSTIKGNVKFAYAMAKNKQRLQSEVETLKDLIKPSKALEQFEAERLSMCQEMCEKDDEGKPVIKNNTFVMTDPAAFETKFEELKEKYKTSLDEQVEKKKDFDALLEEDAGVELYKIKLDNFPDDLSPAQMEWLMHLVDE